MTNMYVDPNSNRSPFEQAFMHAVRAVIACNDDLANCALNEARRHISGNSLNIDVKGLESLYGDLHYEAENPGPWIGTQKQMMLIAETVRRLGDADDIKAFNEFSQKVSTSLKRPLSPVLKLDAA